MKKILFLAAMLLGTVATYAQNDDYIPLVREGSEWCYWQGYQHDFIYSFYTIKGDTVAYGRTYKKVYYGLKYIENDIDGNPHITHEYDLGVFCALREEGRKVFKISSVYLPKYHHAIYGGIVGDSLYYDGEEKTCEYVLYDFNDVEEHFRQCHAECNMDRYEDYALPATDGNILGTNKCYKLGGPFYAERFVAEGIGLYCHEKAKGNFAWRLFPTLNFHDGGSSNDALIYMKNPQGEFEYLDEELYNKIKDVVETPSAVTDVTVTKPTDNRYYNLMGQPVAHPEDAPGIYIHEGKKVKF